METEVRDMYLAAVFLAYGAQLAATRKMDTKGKRLEFVFNMDNIKAIYIQESGKPMRFDKPSADDIKLYFTSSILWLPPEYPNSLRQIKSLIHDSGSEYVPSFR